MSSVRIVEKTDSIASPARSVPPEMAGLLARPSRPMTAADDPVKLVHQVEA